MQAPSDNSVSAAEPHIEPYSDNNLNEKNLGTQYIYTTEGQLIPAGENEANSNMNLNTEHCNTVHITEAQSIHIEQVDYQYEQQYPDNTVQHVGPVSGTESVEDLSDSCVVEEPASAPESAQENSNIMQPLYSDDKEAEQEATTSDDPVISEVEEIAEQPMESKTDVSIEPVSDKDQSVTCFDEEQNQQEDKPTGEMSENPVPEGSTEQLINSAQVASASAESTSVNDKPVPTTSELIPASEESTTTTVKSVSATVESESARAETVPTSTEPVLELVTVDHSVENTIEVNDIHDIEMKEEQIVKSAEEVGTEEDQTNLESLKSNPAIEIQHDENEEPVQEIVQEARTEEVEENVVDMSTSVESAVEALVDGTEVEDSSQEVIVPEDPSYVSEIAAETEVANSKVSSESNPRPRGRKPKADIPLHILGHDVSKPMENFVNGKTPKPRLGVKVPYRNLTSQIVSKAEIEKEIIDRGRKKQEEKKEISFARQLTARLAEKIAPESKSSKTSKKKGDVGSAAENQLEVDNNGNEEVINEKSKCAIDNNSDLLAILEGDADTEEIPEIPAGAQNKESTPTDETNLKNLEREIALQQLHDLPYLSPKTKFIKPNRYKMNSKEVPGGSLETNVSSPNDKTEVTVKPQTPKSPIKSNVLKLDVEPQIKVNMTLKTYSRKRKSTDAVVETTPPPSKKTNVVVDTDEIDIKPAMHPPTLSPVYVTKSSRVIKKKVIWDPDEVPSRTKPSPVKAEASAQPKIVPKPTPPKNENKPADLPKKSAASTDLSKKSTAPAESSKKSSADAKGKVDKKAEDKPSSKKTVNVEKKTSPSPTKLVVKPKKPKSEVDRLLGDEGAIKMLYDLKNSETAIEEKRKKTVISVEKTFKDLAKKANQIKSDLVNTSTVETPKSLRKKEPTVSPVTAPKPATPLVVLTPVVPGGISRQKSKDSARSTPPPTPAFTYPNEVSFLIRRRSSSSITSGEDTGGSLDFDDIEERFSKKRPISTSSDPLKIKKSKKNSENEKSRKRTENRIGHYKTFNLKKMNKGIIIDLHTDASTKFYLTSEVLGELTTALNKISKEKDCQVVLIRSSNDNVFSYGLNYKHLVSDKDTIRKNKANELADRVKNFIQCLMDFPKILIAGIKGECRGLAVTMLPLFDIVIASDDAQFSTSYAALGCTAEAGFLLTVPHVSSYGLAGELLFTSQKLNADEVCRRGLISKLCWPEKYQETLKSTLMAVSQGSKQSLEATKMQLRATLRENSAKAIESMVPQLVEHWTSSECQNNFAKIE